METFKEKATNLQLRSRLLSIPGLMDHFMYRTTQFSQQVKELGLTMEMDDFEKRKLAIFNQINFLQLITGIFIPLLGLLHHDSIPFHIWFIACIPSITSLIALYCNAQQQHITALLLYFTLYPFFTCLVYLYGMNSGVGLNFILFGILSVFFLQDMGYMIFSITLSMLSFIMLNVVIKHYEFQVENENSLIYFLNQLVASAFIFYGLYLIKRENSLYQLDILKKNRKLQQSKQEIECQKEVIAEKATLLENQKVELTELNSLKNKLFSIISHDLKSPMYALRTLFRNIHQYDIPPEELKQMIPDVVNDLNYTISLMENLLQWSKSQMEGNAVHYQQLDVNDVIQEVVRLLHLQADAKKINLVYRSGLAPMVRADRDMIHLVLRNLISNAIKFTPEAGTVTIGVNTIGNILEIYIQDSGVGMTPETIRKISQKTYFTTKGTSSESGTGLGLMLCNEFIVKNGGQLHIESEPGNGSTFSFSLPACP